MAIVEKPNHRKLAAYFARTTSLLFTGRLISRADSFSNDFVFPFEENASQAGKKDNNITCRIGEPSVKKLVNKINQAMLVK